MDTRPKNFQPDKKKFLFQIGSVVGLRSMIFFRLEQYSVATLIRPVLQKTLSL
jgi:hypothetical protein